MVQFAHVHLRVWCSGSPCFSSYHQRGPWRTRPKTSIMFWPLVLQPPHFSTLSTTMSDPNVVFILLHSSAYCKCQQPCPIGTKASNFPSQAQGIWLFRKCVITQDVIYWSISGMFQTRIFSVRTVCPFLHSEILNHALLWSQVFTLLFSSVQSVFWTNSNYSFKDKQMCNWNYHSIVNWLYPNAK